MLYWFMETHKIRKIENVLDLTHGVTGFGDETHSWARL